MTTCEHCRYWRKQDGGPNGECRLNPPSLSTTMERWPTTVPDDWCGKWESGLGAAEGVADELATTLGQVRLALREDMPPAKKVEKVLEVLG